MIHMHAYVKSWVEKLLKVLALFGTNVALNE